MRAWRGMVSFLLEDTKKGNLSEADPDSERDCETRMGQRGYKKKDAQKCEVY